MTAQPTRGPRAVRARRFQLIRYAILTVIGLFLAVPQLSLLEFSTRGIGLAAPRTLEAWRRIADPGIIDAIVASLELAVLTSVLALALMVPTMVWVRLRVPRMTRVVEFLCLLPLTAAAQNTPVGHWRSIDDATGKPKAVIEAGVQEMAEKGRQVVEEVKKQVSGREE